MTLNRKNSLLNTKEEPITKVKHLHSFIGLYITLHMLMATISGVLAPLEEAAAGKLSSDSHKTSEHYLPHLDDQLIIKTDAALKCWGTGQFLHI